MTSLSFHLTQTQLLMPDGLNTGDLAVTEGRITTGTPGRKIDLGGYLVLPGIVDIHGDGFERHLAARRGAMKNMDQGLFAAEAELAANGVTTAVLAQFYSWEGGQRGPDFARRMLAALKQVRGKVVTDLRAQLRFETHMLADYAEVESLIASEDIGYVVFNDHIPHDKLIAGKKPPRLTGTALKSGRSPEAHLALMQALHTERDKVPEAVSALAQRLATRGIVLGSHDDRTAEQRQTWHRSGVYIAEFPETTAAVDAARIAGDGVVLGAPNVTRGGSHNGNVSALEMVMLGNCDALASDYHYPSMRRAAWMLVDGGVTDLAGAWALLSSGPARLLGLADRGTLEVGKRADFVVLDSTTRRIAATFANGRVSYMSGDIAERFIA